MPEESDAGTGSADDEPTADTDEGTPSDASDADSEERRDTPSDDGDGNSNGDADDRVESQVEPEVNTTVGSGNPADAANAGENDPDAEDDPDAGDDPHADAGDDGTAHPEEADEDEPIGAVTDASSPPSASAPGVSETEDDVDDGSSGDDADEDDADDGSGGDDSNEDDADATGGTVGPEDSFAPPDESGALTPADASQVTDAEAATEGTVTEDGEADEDEFIGPEPADEESSAHGTVDLPGEQEFTQPPEGPPDDQEMPLADHIEEMVLRLAVVSAVGIVAAGAVFLFEPLAEDMIMFIWESVIPRPDVPEAPALVGGTAWAGHYIAPELVPTNPRVYGPLELKLTELKFAGLVGFVLALPVFVYETYRFMRPGLYPHERRYYLAAVPTSLVLAFVGVSFAYFIILPAIFAYFVRYSERAGLLAFALRQTFDLILILMGYMALVFQIPLFIMLAIMMGLTDRQWLESRRLYFWGGFLGVSFLFVPEPTGMAPILVALTMIGLFEGTLTLLRWTGN